MSQRPMLSGLLLMTVALMGCRQSEADANSGSSVPQTSSPQTPAGSSPCPALPDASRKITITSPCEGATVEPRHFAEGVVSDINSRVSVVIHPMEAADYWVQPNVTVRDTGKWKVLCYFGEPGQQHSGKSYEVMAFVNPNSQLSEGQVLSDWPEAQSRSQVVEVVRK